MAATETPHTPQVLSRRTCTRCSGSGLYGSFGTCFGCAGTGVQVKMAELTAEQKAENRTAAWSEHDRLEAERKARMSARKTRAAELVVTGMDQRTANRQARAEIN